ncbi:hypothetical protein [Streptomyces sp. NPDC093109]|uniref:hypothetical protein n=1 Tax=Streptomyces sp. NPDC093109 TaxID=3154977 RepID=UPI00344E0B3D
MTTTLHGTPLVVLETFALPDLNGLAEDKARGAECLWCPARLTVDAVVDLGKRETAPGRCVFPRACPPCTATAAHRALLDHGGRCEQCADEAAECPVGRGLYRLIRTGRRGQGDAR